MHHISYGGHKISDFVTTLNYFLRYIMFLHSHVDDTLNVEAIRYSLFEQWHKNCLKQWLLYVEKLDCEIENAVDHAFYSKNSMEKLC